MIEHDGVACEDSSPFPRLARFRLARIRTEVEERLRKEAGERVAQAAAQAESKAREESALALKQFEWDLAAQREKAPRGPGGGARPAQGEDHPGAAEPGAGPGGRPPARYRQGGAGDFLFSSPIDVAEARRRIGGGFASAIGHEGSAAFPSAVLGVDIQANCVAVAMEAGLSGQLDSRAFAGQGTWEEVVAMERILTGKVVWYALVGG